jgi:hypothetical protein
MTYDPPILDETTGANLGVDYSHHEVHEGESYIAPDVQAVDTTTIKWQITTPDTTKWAHMIPDIACTSECLITITEGSDRIDGTSVPAINRDRNSSNVAGIVVTRTPTGGTTDGATTIFKKRLGTTGAGPFGASAPGSSRGVQEYKLKQNTKYVVAVQTFAAAFVSADFNWYEHTDK